MEAEGFFKREGVDAIKVSEITKRHFSKRFFRTEAAIVRKHVQDFHNVSRYLSDANGAPIPLPVLYEIVRLMTRDKPDSYVRKSGDWHTASYVALNLRTAVRHIVDRIETIRSKWFGVSAPRDVRIGDSEASTFVLLRMMLDRLK